MEELARRYRARLRGYRFESPEEAAGQGMESFLLREAEGGTSLETPYTMRRAAEGAGGQRSAAAEAEEEEESSFGENTSDTPYYGDIVLDIDLFVGGRQIVDDSQITLVRGEKYGLVGRNGIGKTTLLKALRKRRFGISRGLKIHSICQDYVSNERVIDYVGADAGRVLSGLGFTRERQEQTFRELSGGWRMRAQLAKAIHIAPDLLLLDEPTNFLDIAAIAFLEAAVREMKTVLIVSHDRNFLNATTNVTLHLVDSKIDVYRGNYAAFTAQRSAALGAAVRAYEQTLSERAHLQAFVDRFRYSASRAAQAQSKLKTLSKLPVLAPPRVDPVVRFHFDASPIDGTLLTFEQVAFGYADSPDIFKALDFRVRRDSRIVIVGGNGQGKSTLLKLLAGDLRPRGGAADVHPGLRPGYFAQHHIDHLDLSAPALPFLMRGHREDVARRALGAFGLNIATQRIGTLSGGQKSRLAFAILNLKVPNLLLLDEPTNHLDMETIDALAAALRDFQGAVVCVSHDIAFIEKAFEHIYVCENGRLARFNGSVADYKNSIVLPE